MIEINLLPEDLRKKEMMQFKLPEWPKLKVYAIALAAFLGIQTLATVFAFYQKLEIIAVRGQIASIKQENPELMARKGETAAADGRLKQIDLLTARKFYWATLLNRLAHSITKGVWLREFSVQTAQAPERQGEEAASAVAKRQVKLYGSAIGAGQETAHIGRFVKSLEENRRFADFFEEIDVSNINQRKVKDFDVYDFELSCTFKKEGA